LGPKDAVKWTPAEEITAQLAVVWRGGTASVGALSAVGGSPARWYSQREGSQRSWL